MKMKRIAVVGSLNMDLVAGVDRFPQPGETMTGRDFHTYPGGKGANQAVAARRLGAEVQLFGKVGDDLYGTQYLKYLRENGVNTEGITVESGISTGIALIEVDSRGENHIVVIPGANQLIDSVYIDRVFPEMLKSDIFLFQLETPIDGVLYSMRRLKEEGKTVILDPAPANAAFPDVIFQYVDYLTPNESELALISGERAEGEEAIGKAATRLLKKGVGSVLLKAGKDGAYLINEAGQRHISGFVVKSLDTTGAGDAFNAGFAVALARGYDLEQSLRFANAVGALSTLANGAQSAAPTGEEVHRFMEERFGSNE